ncbi:MAG: sigma-54 dependent transcriptional regulator [Rhodospirillales bacterium]|nr:sigma-54 dependent transcriptional regulator [Rhodospirillales bacterium]
MRLLIIGGLSGQVGAASRIAVERGAKVAHADDIETGMKFLRAGQGADLVLIDVALDIALLIDRLRSERFAVPVIAGGIGTDSRAAVAAIRAGAKEYVPLPPDPELIAAILAAVTEDSHAIVHADPKMAEVIAMADRIAGRDASVLITGPSGTGKELLARYLHAKSRRAGARFVAVNCAAIPETLLESELFGHEKGAFTGAVARRIGRFEEASGGTLLLDEISEMDLRLQAKLLRALQEREIDRLGGTAPVKVDVRILATSNRNLSAAVAAGEFRGDLYFRLNVVNLAIPALAERPRDIPVLARHFIATHARANDIAPPALTEAAERALLAYPWPGNVRELENAMHRAVLLSTGPRLDVDEIMLSAAPHGAAGAADAGAASLVGRTVADVERDLIIDTVKHCLGNRTHAATILGISIRTLRNKLRQYTAEGVPVPAPAQG